MAYQGNHPLAEKVKHEPHVQSRLQRHAALEEQLRAEMRHPLVDWDRVRELKLEKLHLTEELVKYQDHPTIH
jgi:hypothetical protein